MEFTSFAAQTHYEVYDYTAHEEFKHIIRKQQPQKTSFQEM